MNNPKYGILPLNPAIINPPPLGGSFLIDDAGDFLIDDAGNFLTDDGN